MNLRQSPNECFAARRERFLADFSAPAAFASGLARVRNFEANRFPFRAESHFLYFIGKHIEGALLSFDDGAATLYVPHPEPGEALWRIQKGPDAWSSELGMNARPLDEFEPKEDVATLASDDTETALWQEDILGRIVDAGAASDAEEQDAELADCMVRLRLRHDAWAIAQIEAASAITCRAHREGMRVTNGATTEAQVRAAMEATIAAEGLSTAYGSIVTTEGQVLHHEHSFRTLEPGALLLADVGAESPEGWASDVTRTWPCNGRFDSLQRELYDAVLQAQQQAILMLAPGVNFRDVHLKAAETLVAGLVGMGLLRGTSHDLLERGAAGLFFPHGVGHLLGLDVHDMEDLGDRAGYAPGRRRSKTGAERFLRLDRDLEPSMVVTIEPGFYLIPHLLDDRELRANLADAIDERLLERVRTSVRGIRIEDDVLITEDGPKVLTDSCPKTASEVEALVLGG